ncbi:MAG: hypothetical protein ISQ32_06065 [Rickettsiales bacterium]|nr:hypothetical protein [Rickettsiales bacterium]
MSFFYGDTKTDELVVGQTSSSNGYIDLYDSGTTNKITLRAPDSITSSYNLTLPSVNGTEDQVITINGTGGNMLFVDAAPSSNRIVFQVKNETGDTITQGTPVYFDGISGQSVLVAPADASNSSKMPAGGIVNETLEDNQSGLLIEQGKLTNIDMSSFSVNDSLYVAVGGGLSNVKPVYPYLIQNIARVTKNVNNGSLIVTGPSRTNDVPNLGDSNIWIGKSGDNTQQVSVSGDLSVSNTGVFTINGISNTATITSTANITMDSDQTINFRDTTNKIYSSVASKLNLEASSNISLESPVVHISDTLRIAENGTGLRMTNVGAFDNDSGDFRIFATNDLKLCANGDTNVGLSIDSTNYDVSIYNDLLPNTAASSSLGSVTKEWSDLYLSDGSVINLGNDQDITITHLPDTGIRINDDSQIQFRNANTSIQSSADSNLSIKVDNTIFTQSGNDNYLTISSNADASCVAVSFIGKSYNSNSIAPGANEGKTGGILDILASSGSSNISGQFLTGNGGTININKFGYGLGGNNFNNNSAGSGSSINLYGGQGGNSYLNTSLDDGNDLNSVGGSGGSISHYAGSGGIGYSRSYGGSINLYGGSGGGSYDGGNGGDISLYAGSAGFGSNSSGSSGNIILGSNVKVDGTVKTSFNSNIDFESNISIIGDKKIYFDSNSYINSEFGSLYIKNQGSFGSTYVEGNYASLTETTNFNSVSVDNTGISLNGGSNTVSITSSNITQTVSGTSGFNTMNGQIVYGVDTLSSGGATDGTRVEIKSSIDYNSVKSIIQSTTDDDSIHYFHANSGGQSGEMMNILYYNANASGSANIDFNTTNLYSGTGANRYLELSTSGQGASLIWIDNASATIAGWRIINTGGAVRGT